MLPSAAPIPPWAAPVCDRIGYSLLSTATLAWGASSRAARNPAPPPPTTIASNSGPFATVSSRSICPHRCLRRLAHDSPGLEGHEDNRAHDPEDEAHYPHRRFRRQSPSPRSYVVGEDAAQPHETVRQGEEQYQHVVDPPQRRAEPRRHEGEVDRIGAVDHVHDVEVAEDQSQHGDRRDPHVIPEGEGEAACGFGFEVSSHAASLLRLEAHQTPQHPGAKGEEDGDVDRDPRPDHREIGR